MTKKKNEEIAVFRFGVIHEFVGGARLSQNERKQLLKQKCARKWVKAATVRSNHSIRIIRG
jgi:hypothetical protein